MLKQCEQTCFNMLRSARNSMRRKCSVFIVGMNCTFILAVIALSNCSFQKHQSVLAQPIPLTPSDIRAGDGYGTCIDIDADYVVIGAPGKDDGNVLREESNMGGLGTAYVFRRINSSVWSDGVRLESSEENKKTEPSDIIFGDSFGVSCAIKHDYVVIGAPGKHGGGAIYVFHRTGPNEWDKGVELRAPDAEPSDMFGARVDTDGSFIAVGAPLKNRWRKDKEHLAMGQVYVFRRTSVNSWELMESISPPENEVWHGFGERVILRDGKVFIGGNPSAKAWSGMVYVYEIE